MQAEINLDKDHSLVFSCKGKSYNFINDRPYNTRWPVKSKARLYDGDRIRLGGNADGKEGGGYARFCLQVNTPALGQRPTPDPAAALPASAPPQAAPPLVAAPATRTDEAHAVEAREAAVTALCAQAAAGAVQAVLARYPKHDRPNGQRSAAAKQRRRAKQATKQAEKRRARQDAASSGAVAATVATAAMEATAAAAVEGEGSELDRERARRIAAEARLADRDELLKKANRKGVRQEG